MPTRPDMTLQAVIRHANSAPRDRRFFIGIDPGVTGAVALMVDLSADNIAIANIPTHQGQGHREFDLVEIGRFVTDLADLNLSVTVTLERQQSFGPKDTPMTAFSVGYGYGMWRTALTMKGLSFNVVPPLTWKAAMLVTSTEKTQSVLRAREMYPQALPYLQTDSSHNRADALLLAAYGRGDRP